MAGSAITADVDINATAERVWEALTDPKQVAKYMMGVEVDTDWQPGSPIYWRGEFQGKAFEDRGQVLEVDRPGRLRLAYFSAMSGARIARRTTTP